jgi:hypothetical protein
VARMASALLERLLHATEGDLPLDYARQLLAEGVTPAEQARCDALSEKAQLGTLTAEERGELEELVAANDLLTILHAKAELSLRAAGPGAAAMTGRP